MEFERVVGNKKDYLPLLLLADEQEDMIDRYLGKGEMYLAKDGRLYVGFAFSAVFGFFETGDFDVAIPVEGEIQEVILKTKQTETSIWTADPGEAAAVERCGVFRYPGRK